MVTLRCKRDGDNVDLAFPTIGKLSREKGVGRPVSSSGNTEATLDFQAPWWSLASLTNLAGVDSGFLGHHALPQVLSLEYPPPPHQPGKSLFLPLGSAHHTSSVWPRFFHGVLPSCSHSTDSLTAGNPPPESPQ